MRLGQLTLALSLALSSVQAAPAANLSLSPSTGTLYYGVPFSLRMLMDTAGEAVVVADPILLYDAALWRIDSVTPNYADPPGAGQFRFLARSACAGGRVQVIVGTPHQTALSGSPLAIADLLATPLQCLPAAPLSYYFLAAGAGGDSNLIRDDGLGTDLLTGVSGGVYRVLPPPRGESADYDADPAAEPVVFRAATGLWSVRGATSFFLGSSGDIPVPGDYGGDGKTDPAVFRPASGLWATRGGGRIYFGGPDDLPLPGDWTGDGTSDLAVFRPADGRWAVRNATRFFFGALGDCPVPADFNRDGRLAAAVFRPSSGLWAARSLTRLSFGLSGDLPVPADYDGDGSEDFAVFRPGSGFWAARSVTRAFFGASGDIPVPADYAGSGSAGMALFRPLTGWWEIRGITAFCFGQLGDLPLSR